jgi:hypothetical protein
MLQDIEFVDGDPIVNIRDLKQFQELKPCPMQRYSHFCPPGEFATRVGRTVSLHVERNDWRQARHTLDAAQLECEEYQRDAVRAEEKGVEEHAADTPIEHLWELGDRERNTLHKHDYDTVADLMLASDEELQRIPDIGPLITLRIRRAIIRAGFELGPLLRD